MLDSQKIPLFRVKEAYRLNHYESQELLKELSPDSVFPYELWYKAYASYWKYPAAEISKLYKVENPPFPEILDLPKKYFPTETYATRIVDFFFEMARRISVKDLEKGFDYIVETTYDSKSAISESERAYIFYHLQLVEKSIASNTRAEGVKNIDLKLSAPDILLKIFPDTVAVDAVAAIHYWSVIRDYPFHHEVKGITHALVRSVIKAAAQKIPPVPETQISPDMEPEATEHDHQDVIVIPRALWEGKTPQQVCADMRVAGHTDDAPIAHALHYWVGIKNLTEIGTILRGERITDSARYKHAQKKLKEAEGRYRTE